jgi:hypothetical protein
MSETVTGVELARLILRRGTTAAEVAAMDVEDVAKVVADRRRKKARGPVDPALTDEQIARAVLEYAQSDPGDWPVAPRATTWKRACGAGLLGALGGGVGAAVFVVLGAWVGLRDYDGQAVVLFLGYGILVTLLSAILGAPLALVVTRRMTGTGRLKRALPPLATGLAVSFIIAAGYWLWFLAVFLK